MATLPSSILRIDESPRDEVRRDLLAEVELNLAVFEPRDKCALDRVTSKG